MDERQLIKDGINWLSTEIRFRDAYRNPNGKPFTQAPAVEYSNTEMRIIRRVHSFLEESEENLKWFHDFLTESTHLAKDVFVIFFRIWSAEFRKRHPAEVSEVIHIRKPEIDWTEVALDELKK